MQLKGLWRVARRSALEVMRDDCLNLAAQLGFYFYLALFPALIALVALIAYLPIESAVASLLDGLNRIAPGEVSSAIQKEIQRVTSAQRPQLLVFGAAGALWSGSSAMAAVIASLNRAYDVEDGRSWWKRRGLSVILAVGLAVFTVTGFLLIIGGPIIGHWLAARVGLGATFDAAWNVLRWPAALFLVVVGIDLVFRFAPDAETRWVWLSPGSVVATTLWLAGSLAFRFYVYRFGSFDATYGALGAAAVLLLWFYVSGLAVLVGAEVDAEADKLVAEGDRSVGQGSGRRRGR